MFDKLRAAEEKFNETERLLSDPEIIADMERYTALMKDYKALSPVIEKYREYKKARDAHEDAKIMLDEPLDAEMKELAQEELKQATELLCLCVRMAVLERLLARQ